MGAIAESIVAYAQPLLDATDGSLEDMNRAIGIGQFCWNLALLPKERQEETLRDAGPTLQMEAEEFEAFRQSVIMPMVQRHEEMFPQLHGRFPSDAWESDFSPSMRQRDAAPTEKYPGTEPYAPCPCNSGRKYKFCCRANRR
jgi:hypothetical protein